MERGSCEIAGPAGRLEALLEEPGEWPPAEAALVCHPHPLYGGTMQNKVVHRIARGLRRAGSVVLRFNFRGVGLSQGEYAHGEGELDDARAALDWLRERYPELGYTLAGFSFGSKIVLRLGCELGGASRLIAAGFPSAFHDLAPQLARCPIPKTFIQSTHDEYGSRESLEAFVARLPPAAELRWIEARDHFFAGGLDELERTVCELVKSPHRTRATP